MIKRLLSLILFLSVGNTVLMGMPLHFGERECAMSAKMDCCKTARQADDSAEVSAARLCCAVNCGQSGATTTMSVQLARFVPLILSFYRPFIRKPFVSPQTKRRYETAKVSSLHSPPAYLKHSAFLI